LLTFYEIYVYEVNRITVISAMSNRAR